MAPKLEILAQDSINTLGRSAYRIRESVTEKEILHPLTVSPHCFIYGSDERETLQIHLNLLDAHLKRVNLEEKPSVFAREIGNDNLIIYWISNVTEEVRTAIPIINHELAEKGIPLIPQLPENNIIPPHEQ